MFAFEEPRTVYSYNDVTLWPRNSENRHIRDANIDYGYKVLGLIDVDSPPLINAPMNTVCSPRLIRYLHDELGMFVTVHRAFETPQDQLDYLASCALEVAPNQGYGYSRVFLAVGSLQNHKEWLDCLVKEANMLQDTRVLPFGFLVDMANGDTKTCIETVEYLSRVAFNSLIMAGNVATKSGYERLAKAGAHFIRVGIGGGAICTTRVNTGFGIPTLHSVASIAPSKKRGTFLVADGGVEQPGDICKAMAAGADMVMVGNMFCATDLSGAHKYCSGGRIDVEHGQVPEGHEDKILWCEYTGMASEDIASLLRKSGTHSVEGVSGLVQYRGRTREYVPKVLRNMQAAMSYYAGVDNWVDFYHKTKFARFDNQGWAESQSRVHGFSVLDRSVDKNQQG